mgnify:CR=1 FL=1
MFKTKLFAAGFFVFLVLLFWGRLVSAEEGANKRADFEKFYQLISRGSPLEGDLLLQSFHMMRPRVVPALPDEVWDEVVQQIGQQELEAVREIAINILEKSFTREEVKEMNDFLESAAGRKMAAAMPEAFQEIFTEQNKRANQLDAQVIQALRQRGYELESPLNQSTP